LRRRHRTRPRPDHCGRRIQFDRSRDRVDEAGRTRRCRCRTIGGALLQQADAGRDDRAFPRRPPPPPIFRSSSTTFLHGLSRELSDTTLEEVGRVCAIYRVAGRSRAISRVLRACSRGFHRSSAC
jgi:hypothetical protein